MASCVNHPGVPATEICAECDRKFCGDCLVEIQGKPYCRECKTWIVRKMHSESAGSGRYAGFWIRVVAVVIDGVLLNVVMTVVIVAAVMIGAATLFPMAASGSRAPQAAQAAVPLFLSLYFGVLLLSIAIPAAYEVFMIGRFGATLGKMAIGVVVLKDNGAPVGYGLAFARWAAKILSGMILCIGYIIVGFHEQKKGLHDVLCGTKVVFKR